MDKRRIGVHQAHCCVLHGCKYGEDDKCPVVQEQIKQDYICEYCFEDGLKSIEELQKYLNTGNCCKKFIDFKKNEIEFKTLKNFKFCPFCSEKINHKI